MTRTSIYTLLMAIFLAVSAIVSAPGSAGAMEQGEAEKACAKMPNCFTTYGQDGDMSIVVVTGGGKGNSEIYCPGSGACVCVICVRLAGDNSVRGPAGIPLHEGFRLRKDESGGGTGSGETGNGNSGPDVGDIGHLHVTHDPLNAGGQWHDGSASDSANGGPGGSGGWPIRIH